VDIEKLAALTALDFYVVAALALLATVMWLRRRFVGVLLRFVPVCLALGGTAGAWGLYRVGEDLNWDTPGSAGILLVVIALGAAVIIAIGGWIAVAFQIRRLRKPRPPRSPARTTTFNNIRVAFSIVFVVWALFSVYRYVRTQWPSHYAPVVQLVYSHDGDFLYSLDESGVLKKWSTEHRFEADRWKLPREDALTQMLVGSDGRVLLTLQGEQLSSWSLGESGEAARGTSIGGVRAIVPVGDVDFWLLEGNALSLRTNGDITASKATITLPFEALTLSAFTDYKAVVGASDGGLRFYVMGPVGITEIDVATPPLDVYPKIVRADRGGRFLVVSDGETKMAVLDLQTLRHGTIPESLFADRFEITGAGKLLLAEVAVTKYDLASASTEPFFNHGGNAMLAVSPRDDVVAIADRRQIYVRIDTQGLASPELWLNGKVEIPELIARLRR
jgi:hypothetical protein